MAIQRRFAVGAEFQDEAGVHFRVHAGKSRRVTLWLEPAKGAPAEPIELMPEEGRPTYFSRQVPAARPGMRYRYSLDDDALRCPDPAARYQPEGPHGPSQVVAAGAFAWSDQGWPGVTLAGQVLYEMHAGTFTQEGTWAAAASELPELAAAGITLVELMPIAEFPGCFGWGYDGVDLYAPSHLYGTPDDLRHFIDVAHGLGLGVILDVVYNHIGPDGNYLARFYPELFTPRYKTDWGDAINYDGPDSAPVREFMIENAAYWIGEFHFDGLRIDAAQNIYDASDDPILAAMTRRCRQAAQAQAQAQAKGRSILLFVENEVQHARLVRPPEQGGLGLDAVWNDDFHHSAQVALTGRREAYYVDYLGVPQEFIDAVKWGYLYQGQHYRWQNHRRGTPSLDLDPARFVSFLQNHDQVANSGRGQRIHQISSPGCFRAMTALLLLVPSTPLLFQGQEFCASAPFLYFADHVQELARLVNAGRAQSLKQFRSLASKEMQGQFAPPESPATFAACKLDLSERRTHAAAYDLHRDLLRLRRQDPTLSAQRKGAVDGAVLGPEALCLRFFGAPAAPPQPVGASSGANIAANVGANDRLLILNLGHDLPLLAASSPLLAPPENAVWGILWSSEDPRYGGTGTPLPETDQGWLLSGQSAVLLHPVFNQRPEEPAGQA